MTSTSPDMLLMSIFSSPAAVPNLKKYGGGILAEINQKNIINTKHQQNDCKQFWKELQWNKILPELHWESTRFIDKITKNFRKASCTYPLSSLFAQYMFRCLHFHASQEHCLNPPYPRCQRNLQTGPTFQAKEKYMSI